MQGKWYSEAVRDLFRAHCEENKLSSENVTANIVRYFYDEASSEGAIGLYEVLRDDIQKLRYKPKSRSARDLTFENKGELLSWIVPYLREYETQKMEHIMLTELVSDIVASFPDAEKINNKDSLFDGTHGRQQCYESFIGRQYKYNFPKSRLYKVNGKAISPRVNGVVCVLSLQRSFGFGDEEGHKIYKMNFYESKSNYIDSMFGRVDSPLKTQTIEMVGVRTSQEDNTFIFKDILTKKSYIANFTKNGEGEIEWHFISTVPEFLRLFLFTKRGATSFPKMASIHIETAVAFDFFPCLPDGRRVSDVAPRAVSRLRKMLPWNDFSKVRFTSLIDLYTSLRIKNDLHKAVAYDSLRDVKRIIAKSKNALNAVNSDGDTPVFLALSYQRWEILDYMLGVEDGVRKDIKNKDGMSLIDLLLRAKIIDGNFYRQLVRKLNSK